MEKDETVCARLAAAVGGARRRAVAGRVLSEGILAATIALLGPTLLLLLGKDLFAWPLPVALAIAGSGLAVWRLRRGSPDLYKTSQILDMRLGTEDQIATAIHFLESRSAEAMLQRQAAARLALRLNLKAAFPIALPRSLYGLGAVVSLALACGALRHFLENPLLIERPLHRVVLETLLGGDQARRDPAALARQNERASSESTVMPAPREDEQDSQDLPLWDRENWSSMDNTFAPYGEEDQNPGGAEDISRQGPENGSAELGGPIDAASRDEATTSSGELQDGEAQPAPRISEKGEGIGSNGRLARGDSSSENLLDRLRDAMSNMLSSLQRRLSGGAPPEDAARPISRSAQRDGAGDQKGENGEPEDGGPEMAGAESLIDGTVDLNTPGEGGGEEVADENSRTGSSNVEGDKQLAEAQHQTTMGKLGELYAQRSASVTGFVTIETRTGNQKTLRTPAVPRHARHGNAGGEMSRDEVPTGYRAYINNYYDELLGSDDAGNGR